MGKLYEYIPVSLFVFYKQSWDWSVDQFGTGGHAEFSSLDEDGESLLRFEIMKIMKKYLPQCDNLEAASCETVAWIKSHSVNISCDEELLEFMNGDFS